MPAAGSSHKKLVKTLVSKIEKKSWKHCESKKRKANLFIFLVKLEHTNIFTSFSIDCSFFTSCGHLKRWRVNNWVERKLNSAKKRPLFCSKIGLRKQWDFDSYLGQVLNKKTGEKTQQKSSKIYWNWAVCFHFLTKCATLCEIFYKISPTELK